jgi:hypothetical protein
MIFASDEVGSFDVAHSGFDPSLWVTLACPPAAAQILRLQVAFWLNDWQVDELHARDLAPSQRLAIAHYLSGTDAFWMAAGTDRELMTVDEVREWRNDQADIAREAFDASVQMVVQAAMRRYGDSASRHGWQSREWLIDGKGAGRHGGPKLFNEILLPCLAGRTLHLPVGLRARDHPIGELIDAHDDGLGILDLLGGMPTFVPDSSTEPLIQLADLIGWAARRRITHRTSRPPATSTAHCCAGAGAPTTAARFTSCTAGPEVRSPTTVATGRCCTDRGIIRRSVCPLTGDLPSRAALPAARAR